MPTRIAALLFLVAVCLGTVSGACKKADVIAAGGSGGGGGRASGGGNGGESAGGQSGSGSDQGGSSGSGAGGESSQGGQGGNDGQGGNGGPGGKGGKGGSTGRDASAKDAIPGGSKDAKVEALPAQPAIDGGAVSCDDITSPGRLAVYYYCDSAASGSSIQMHLDIVNYTAFTSRLTQVTVRYWFTDEAASSANVMEQYYVPIPTTMKFITLNPPRADADTVLEMSFASAPDAGSSFVETRGFNFAFHKTSYNGDYDQTNDYSYDPTLKSALGLNPKITAYINGVLAWGCEPI